MMHRHETPLPATFRNASAPRGFPFLDSTRHPELSAKAPRYHAHGRAALANALDEGLMADEVEQILRGRTIVDAFPVWVGESPTDYAARAVAEMFVAYLQ